jgi:hypothetical protein
MKKTRTILFLFVAVAFSIIAFAQEKSATEIKQIVESQNYIFKAETVIPQSGSSRVLTPEYDLTVSCNKVISYLPYFGRAYTPVLPGEGGIKFTSTDFEYKKTKDGDKWEITIQPNDVNYVRQMHLTVFDNGKASLNVINTNRQGIAYHGYIKEGMMKEKKAF